MARLYTGFIKQKTAGESEGKHMCHIYMREGKGKEGNEWIQNKFLIFETSRCTAIGTTDNKIQPNAF